VAIKPQPILKSATLRLMKAKPYVFLLVLVALLIFILGVRYGQKVEKTNKTINYLISLPPTQPPLKTKPLDYLTYRSTACGISFLYPSSLVVKEQTTTNILFTDKDKKNQMILVECPALNTIIDFDKPEASAEVAFKKQKIITDIYKRDGREYYLLALNDFVKNKQLICEIEKSLFPLFEKTLEFISPTP